MKKLVATVLALGAIGSAGSALAASSVGLSIGINQPGVFGEINIGNLPPPALIAAQPILVAPVPPGAVAVAPAYLYVPPAERLNWRRYCGRYNACGRPVYFVREDWVRDRYVHEHPGWDRRHEPRDERRYDERREHDRRD